MSSTYLKRVAALSVMAFLLPGCKQPATADTWIRTCGGTFEDCGSSVQQTAKGGYIVVGNTQSFGYFRAVCLAGAYTGGDALWTKVY